jgi:hypothetical protein
MAFIEQVGRIRIEETDDTISVWWPDWIISSADEHLEGGYGVEVGHDKIALGRGCKAWLGCDGKLFNCHPHLMVCASATQTARELLATVRVGLNMDGSGGLTIPDMVRIAGNRDAWTRFNEDTKL